MENNNKFDKMYLNSLYPNLNLHNNFTYYDKDISDKISNNSRKIIRDLISVMDENNLGMGLENTDSIKTS